jgi:DMSO reductase anchor subunit
MHPALSVIFFTVVSGTGYGLLFLIGVVLALDPAACDPVVALLSIGGGGVLAAAGLTSSTLHLGRPLRAWRAFSQWRSSWLSREGVAALLCFVPIVVLGALVWQQRYAPAAGAALAMRETGAVLAVAALATVFCTARIYTSLKTIAAWHNGYVLPGYLLLGLLGGALTLGTIHALAGSHCAQWLQLGVPLLVAMTAIAAAWLKHAYWRFIDSSTPASTSASATGLGRFGAVRGVEAPHTEQNYLTHEMGFVVARKHSARLRRIAVLAFAAAPVALVVIAALLPSSRAAAFCTIVALVAGTMGIFVERWLFFAEARHVVMLYYAGTRGSADG